MSYFIAAYTMAWVAALVYLFSIDRRQRAVSQSLRQLLESRK